MPCAAGLSIAFNTRAYPKNRDVLTSMMKTRYEIATLLGYPSWADYNAADKMIGQGRNIADFIQQVDDASPATGQARIRYAACREAEDRSRRDGNLGLRT